MASNEFHRETKETKVRITGSERQQRQVWCRLQVLEGFSRNGRHEWSGQVAMRNELRSGLLSCSTSGQEQASVG